MYSIVDVETTGLSPRKEKITEIAIYVHDGEKVVDELVTLINPEIEIPYRITQLTGIDNKLVKEAPCFYEVARQVVEMTEGSILVGHNVHFDYNFIRKEFREFGYDFQRKKICTARLSRKLLPGRRSYALGKLCTELGIENPHRHRAYGDARATIKLFEILLKVEKNLQDLSLKGLNTSLDREKLRALPRESGVYYFYNDEGNLIYVGKSRNIHDRVLSHLSNHSSKRAIEMRNRIAEVGYERTGNELIALLLESNEIKKHLPHYNRAQKRKTYLWGLYMHKDQDGYLRLKLAQNKTDEIPLTSFSSSMAAKSHLFMLTEAFSLCQKLCGLFDTKGACFHYNLKQCHGACIGEEGPESYNERVLQATEPYRFDRKNFLIIDRGRNDGEKSVVGVENGRYLGFGYIDFEMNGALNLEDLKGCLKKYPDNRDVQQIIRAYAKRNPSIRIVDF